MALVRVRKNGVEFKVGASYAAAHDLDVIDEPPRSKAPAKKAAAKRPARKRAAAKKTSAAKKATAKKAAESPADQPNIEKE